MADTMVKCPHCGHAFPLTKALAAELRGEVEAALAARHEAEMQRLLQRVARAEEAELESKRRALQLEQTQASAIERARLELEARLRAEAAGRVEQLEAEISATRRELAAAQAAEFALRQQTEALAVRERQLDLEVARRLDDKRRAWEAQFARVLAEEHQLKLREKDRTIDELRRLLEEARRRSEQGSQEQQGEVLEIDIQAGLDARFPRDVVRAVPKGTQGADLLHEVRDTALQPCGVIVWEIKNTKHWQPSWVGKLKDDQRRCGAALAVLVTAALPPEARAGFALVDGVWVTGLATWPALAVALREQLIQVAFARNAAAGASEKVEGLYRYLSSDAFRHKVETIVETFTAMKEQLDRERRAMQRLWKEREAQIQRVVDATAGMYGELRGTIGQALRPIPALELDTETSHD